MAGNSARPGVSVTSRALALLGAFDDRHRRLTLSELADRTGLPLPTAHRLVGELAEWGALTRDDNGRYAIGRRLWDVGLLAPLQTGLREIAAPHLHDLYGATFATIHLAVREDLEVLYIDRMSGKASVPIVSTIGTRLPLHATGVGKVLLAHAPDDVVDRVLANLTRVTAHTVTQPGALRRQLAAVRRDDHAATVEEMSPGACSLGVPVRVDARVVAALGIVVPTLRDRRQLVSALAVAAQGIGRSLREARRRGADPFAGI